MNKILLLTHNGWGMELSKSIEMIIGKVDCVQEVALSPIDTFQDYYQRSYDVVKDSPLDYLLIVDLFGGTPSNVASLLARNLNCECVCGLNASVLLSACLQIQSQGRVDITELINETADSIFDLKVKIKLKEDNYG